MLDIRLSGTDTADDDEVAACTAALSAILAQERAASSAAQKKPDRSMSGWRRQAIGKGVNCERRLSLNLGWRASLLALALVFTSASYSRAADMPSPGSPPPPSHYQPELPALPTIGDAAFADAVAPESLPAPPMVRVALAFARADSRIGLPQGGVLTDVKTGDLLAQLPPASTWSIAYHGPLDSAELSFTGCLSGKDPVYVATRSEYRNVAFVLGAALPPAVTMSAIPEGTPARFWLPALHKDNRGSSSLSEAIEDGDNAPQAVTKAPRDGGRQYLLSPSGPDAVFTLGGKQYRGSALINPKPGGGFDVINQVDLEEYLQSVVAAEMPYSWPLEALKAQAIAARSYAVANLGKHNAEGYDLKATVDDQVYTGVVGESPTTTAAVTATAGLVLRYQGQVITAYFHSSSGGHTELAENVWTTAVPYLKAVPDYDDQSPYFSWSRCLQTAAIEQSLRDSGKDVGAVLTIEPVQRGVSARVRSLLISGSHGCARVSGEEARRLFCLPSTCFNVRGTRRSFVFAGRGFGHGLGMSQWGAKRLADAGYSAADILNYYYKDVSIERM